ncbi:RNA polymerase II transcription factor B 52 kDa subunit [Hypoxylon texense]
MKDQDKDGDEGDDQVQPVDTIYENQALEATSPRELPTGFTPVGSLSNRPRNGFSPFTPLTNRQTGRQRLDDHPGPLTSHPITRHNPLPTTASRGDLNRPTPGHLRPSKTMSNLPVPSNSPRYPLKRSPQVSSFGSQSKLPVPKGGLTPSQSSAALSRFKEENVPPGSPMGGIGARARDSLLLPTTKSLPKKQRPSEVQPKDSSIQEAALASKIPHPTVSPIAITQPQSQNQNTFQEFPAPAPTPLSQQPQQPQQQQKTPIAQQQQQQQEDKDKLADLPASKLPASKSSKLPTSQSSKLPRQSLASKAKNAFKDLPTSRLPKSKASSSSSSSQQQQQPSGIPRARTLGLLSNLSASFSRTSLSSFGRTAASRKPSSSSMADSNSNSNSASKRSGSASGNNGGGGGSSYAPSGGAPSTREGTPIHHQQQGGSPVPPVPSVAVAGPSTSTSASVPQPSSTIGPAPPPRDPPVRNPNMVYEAQGFRYWAGRFMSTQDRLKNELLQMKNLRTILGARAQQQSMAPAQPSTSKAAAASSSSSSNNAAGLPTSYTTANISRVPHHQPHHQQGHHQATAAGSDDDDDDNDESILDNAALLLDDDKLLKRTFTHLESVCQHNEALASMHRFQQAYARKHNKPAHLPKGGTMTDDDPRARDFGVYPAYGDRRDDNKGKGKKVVVAAAGAGAGGSNVASGSGSGSGGAGNGNAGDGNGTTTQEANDEASMKEASNGDKDSKDDEESNASVDGKGDKKKGKGWVGRMFSGGKKGGNTSPK